jgi:hypothetical protein
MTNWKSEFNALSSDDLDGVAVLRLLETSNGCIQTMFRSNDPDALSVEETRRAMKFSMSSIKQMSIELDDGTVTFSDTAKELLGRVRKLYISGFKNGNEADFDEFMKASVASLQACGLKRIFSAKSRLYNYCYELPSHTWDLGLIYILSLLTNS